MLNKPKTYAGLDEDLIIAWKYCEDDEHYQEDLISRIEHLEMLLNRYSIIHNKPRINTNAGKIYDCSTRDAKMAWIYSDKLKRQNQKLERVLVYLNKQLSAYGCSHPEIMNDPGII